MPQTWGSSALMPEIMADVSSHPHLPRVLNFLQPETIPKSLPFIIIRLLLVSNLVDYLQFLFAWYDMFQ